MELAHDVHFALAACARTRPAQFFERDETFTAIVPLQRQLAADLLEVNQSHICKIEFEAVETKRCSITCPPCRALLKHRFAKSTLAKRLEIDPDGAGKQARAARRRRCGIS